MPAFGQLLKAIGQAAKYAVRNRDEPTADHAADLLTELGAGLLHTVSVGEVNVARGVLSEAAQILDQIATQCDPDSLIPEALHADAEMARQLMSR